MKTYYKRNLPHYTPEGCVFFITSRLAGSLPQKVIDDLKKRNETELAKISNIKNLKKQKEEYYQQQEVYFQKFDSELNNSTSNPFWLKNDRIAEIVKEALHFRDKKVYDLFAYSIMPNHIHIVIKPIIRQLDKSSNDSTIGRKNPSPYILGDIMESLKRYTAFECNKLLNRKGAFWQHENYDHVVRNQEELFRIVHYILNNPVKAGLCQNPDFWKWNYFNANLIGF